MVTIEWNVHYNSGCADFRDVKLSEYLNDILVMLYLKYLVDLL